MRGLHRLITTRACIASSLTNHRQSCHCISKAFTWLRVKTCFVESVHCSLLVVCFCDRGLVTAVGSTVPHHDKCSRHENDHVRTKRLVVGTFPPELPPTKQQTCCTNQREGERAGKGHASIPSHPIPCHPICDAMVPPTSPRGTSLSSSTGALVHDRLTTRIWHKQGCMLMGYSSNRYAV